MQIRIQRNGAGEGGARKPVYQQIAEQVGAAIDAGTLRHGDRLPTIRALAEELGVNRDTVSLAYDALARELRGGVPAFFRGLVERPKAERAALAQRKSAKGPAG